MGGFNQYKTFFWKSVIIVFGAIFTIAWLIINFIF